MTNAVATVVHYLKTHCDPFAAAWRGDKTYEVRSSADREFAVGDVVHLREWHYYSSTYTGRELCVRIAYITRPGQWGLPKDLCVFGFREISRSTAESKCGKTWTSPSGFRASCELAHHHSGACLDSNPSR